MKIEIYTDDLQDKSLPGYNTMYKKYMVGELLEDEEGYTYLVQKDYSKLRFFPGVGGDFGSIHHYLVVCQDDRIIGCLKLRVEGGESLSSPGFSRWVCYVTVDPVHQGQGIATALVEAMFAHCDQHGISHIVQSSYTEQGRKKIMLVFDRVAARYPQVDFHDFHRDF